MTMDIEIRRVEKEELAGELFPQFHAISAEYMATCNPDEPRFTEERARLWLDDEGDVYVQWFFAYTEGKMVGYMDFEGSKPGSPDYELNKEMGWFNCFVYPQHRRQGIAKKLAREVFLFAKDAKIKKLVAGAPQDSGCGFLGFLGGKLVSKFSDRILHLDGFNWNIADSWLKIREKLDPNWKIEFRTAVTDEFIEEIVDLDLEIMQELRAMGNNEYRSTREGNIRSWQDHAKWIEKTGDKYFCFLIKDGSGKTVGYTEGGISRDNPEKFSQYATGVSKSSRGLGIGKLLKALMLDFIRREHMEITTIKTGSNDLNAPMHGINNTLGFTAGKTHSSFRIVVEDALKKLESK